MQTLATVKDNPQGWEIGLKIGPRPKLKTIGYLGASLVVTLQRPEEGAAGVGAVCEQLGIEWAHFPLDSRDALLASVRGRQELQKVKAAAQFVGDKIKEQHRVYLHCAAGIHRTGMVTYAWLRHLGFGHQSACDLLGWFRPATLADPSIHPKLTLLHSFLTEQEPSWIPFSASEGF